MIGLFCGCSSLKYLPDISKWNISNVTNLFGIFYECSSLYCLPDISKWNTQNVTDMIFSYFRSLFYLLDISKWNMKNVTNITGMFEGCLNLICSRDNSKLDTKNINEGFIIFDN